MVLGQLLIWTMDDPAIIVVAEPGIRKRENRSTTIMGKSYLVQKILHKENVLSPTLITSH